MSKSKDSIGDLIEESLLAIIEEMEVRPTNDELNTLINGKIHEWIAIAEDEVGGRIKGSIPAALKELREIESGFVERNKERWTKGFDWLEAFIHLCREIGEDFNQRCVNEAIESDDIVHGLLVRLHAWSCQIAAEILCLLENGFADGAQARWRALHELVITACFITKHGADCARRYIDHEVVQSYKGMVQYNEHAFRNQVEPFSLEQVESCKGEYEEMIQQYGRGFGSSYGWASSALGISQPNFSQIERDVEFDHMRPTYKWASQNIHSGVKGMMNKLGLCEADEDILLAGRSNSGMVDPACATAVSLGQVTTTLLLTKPNWDFIVAARIVNDFMNSTQDAFHEELARTTKHGPEQP